MSLKDAIQHDIEAVFMNEGEFMSVRTVNGRPVRCVTDQTQGAKLDSRADASFDANEDTTEIYMVAADLGARPLVNMDMLIDGEMWRVTRVSDEEGIYLIGLTRVSARTL